MFHHVSTYSQFHLTEFSKICSVTGFTCSQYLGYGQVKVTIWVSETFGITLLHAWAERWSFYARQRIQEIPLLKNVCSFRCRNADTLLHDQIFGLEKGYPRVHVCVFNCVFTVRDWGFANIPVLNGLLAACKQSFSIVRNWFYVTLKCQKVAYNNFNLIRGHNRGHLTQRSEHQWMTCI